MNSSSSARILGSRCRFLDHNLRLFHTYAPVASLYFILSSLPPSSYPPKKVRIPKIRKKGERENRNPLFLQILSDSWVSLSFILGGMMLTVFVWPICCYRGLGGFWNCYAAQKNQRPERNRGGCRYWEPIKLQTPNHPPK